jgi:hypothetical protein
MRFKEGRIKSSYPFIVTLLLCSLISISVIAQETSKESVFDKVKWQKGPINGALGKLATVKVPD